MFWNARGVRNKFLELVDLIHSDDIDICCINETFLDDNVLLPRPNGYNIVRLDKTSRSGGLLFLIKNTIDFTIIDYPQTQLFEVGLVRINSTTPFVVYLVYCPGRTADQVRITGHFRNELEAMANHSLPFFILGDFNAKHRAWNCTRNNKAGRLLLETINHNRLFLSHPDTHTYNPVSNRMSPSTIDLMVSDGRISSSSLITIEQLSSDHYPVQFEINSLKGPPIRKSIFDYTGANWTGYGSCIAKLLAPTLNRYVGNNNPSNLDIDSIVDSITNSILYGQELHLLLFSVL